MSTFYRFALTLAAGFIASAMLATSVMARPGQGYERDFSGHTRATPCQEFFSDHPYLDGIEEWVVVEQFTADASFFGNWHHNRNDMASGNRLHECDATVVAYNSLPQGAVLRATYPATGLSVLVVIQDTGGPTVSRRPDLARGAFEMLSGRPAEGVLQEVIYEVLRPAE